MIAALLFAAATAATPGDLVNQDWERVPDSLTRFFPRHAERRHISGFAAMRCKATAQGFMSDCLIVSENPPDEGFGAATLATASLFKLRPTTKDGKPVEGGWVTIPMNWLAPDD